MRKGSFFQVVLLSTFGALAVVGVIVFAFAVGGNKGGGIGDVRIWGTLDAGAFSTVIRQLTDEESRLKQVTYVQKTPETFEQDLVDALASGKGPDLFIMRQDYAEKDAGKASIIPYASFSQEQFQNSFVEAANPYLSPDGVVAVPLAVDPMVLYWNKDLLASAGYSKPPVYWDEVSAMATAITKRDDSNSVIKSGIAFGEYQNVSHAKDILSMLILQAGGVITKRDSAGKLTASLMTRAGETQQPAENALSFYTGFANPVKGDYSWNRSLPESLKSFAAGDLGLYFGYASEEALIRRTNPNLNFGVAPMTQLRSSSRSIDVAHVYAFAVSKSSKNQAGALTVAYLLAAQNPSKLLSAALGIPSARRDVLSSTFSGNDELYKRQAIIAKSWSDPDAEKTEGIFRDMIESVTSGSAKLSEGVQRADQAIGLLLAI